MLCRLFFGRVIWKLSVFFFKQCPYLVQQKIKQTKLPLVPNQQTPNQKFRILRLSQDYIWTIMWFCNLEMCFKTCFLKWTCSALWGTATLSFWPVAQTKDWILQWHFTALLQNAFQRPAPRNWEHGTDIEKNYTVYRTIRKTTSGFNKIHCSSLWILKTWQNTEIYIAADSISMNVLLRLICTSTTHIKCLGCRNWNSNKKLKIICLAHVLYPAEKRQQLA